MSSQIIDRTLPTPTSPVALSWKVVEHETPYTLQYRNGVPYIFGPTDEMEFPGIAASPSHHYRRPLLEIGRWWKLAGLALLVSLIALLLLLPIAFATSRDSAPKSALELAAYSAKLDRLAAANGSSTVGLLHEGAREIAAYQDPQAFTTVSTFAAAKKDAVVTANPDGSLVYFSKANPNHVYMAYQDLPYQFEIFDPTPGVSLKLARTPGLIDSFLA